MEPIEMGRHQETGNGITQKFEALIIRDHILHLITIGTMEQRCLQKFPITEFIPQSLFQLAIRIWPS
jgi:hypothetical protein